MAHKTLMVSEATHRAIEKLQKRLEREWDVRKVSKGDAVDWAVRQALKGGK